jgi:hypothetical protein
MFMAVTSERIPGGTTLSIGQPWWDASQAGVAFNPIFRSLILPCGSELVGARLARDADTSV